MDITPIKPPGKSEPLRDKKPEKAPPPDGVFLSRLMSAGLEATEEPQAAEDREIDDLKEIHQQFVVCINHEINNPLFVVRGMAELISNQEFAGTKKRIIGDTDEITSRIDAFSATDIETLGRECRNAPLSEIAFRKDLVACYLHKVIRPLTAFLSQILDDIEVSLKMEKAGYAPGRPEYDRIKDTFRTIRRQAERIRKIIDRLQELLPDDIEITQYVEDLKMVKLNPSAGS